MLTAKKLLTELRKIHKSIHTGFEYVTDLQQYNFPEVWKIPDNPYKIKGDCEDFALGCRKLCRSIGLPTRLVICLTETGEGHCVLECNGWILDNRYKKVMNRNRVNYTWKIISGFEAGEPWREIVNG